MCDASCVLPAALKAVCLFAATINAIERCSVHDNSSKACSPSPSASKRDQCERHLAFCASSRPHSESVRQLWPQMRVLCPMIFGKERANKKTP